MGLEYYEYEDHENEHENEEIEFSNQTSFSAAYGAYSVCSFITFGFSLFTVNIRYNTF